MTEPLVARILKKYGLEFEQILTPQKGYRNQSFPVVLSNGQMANLILYKSEPSILTKITNANKVSNYLAAQGMPTRQTLSDRIIKLTAGEREKFGALYTYLPGHTIPWEGYTRRHIKLLGKTLSDLHAHLANQKLTETNVVDEYEAIVTRMQHYFNRPEVKKALDEKLNLHIPAVSLTRALKLLKFCQQLPTQTLHMDFVRGNILFEGAGENLKISGILDFEKTAHGPKYFDIARTLAFLLVDCKYVEEAKVKKYFLDSGYEKYGMSSLQLATELELSFPSNTVSFPRSTERIFMSAVGYLKERKAQAQLLAELTNLFLLYDFYKFLRHNPYESLSENEHFLRTKTLLLKRQRLSVSKIENFTIQ